MDYKNPTYGLQDLPMDLNPTYGLK
jgi:hypothetical protein